MDIDTVPLKLRIFPKLGSTDQTINNHLPDVVHGPFMVPLLLQSLEIIVTEPTPKPIGELFRMSTFHMLIQHRFKVKHLIAVLTFDRRVFVVIFHVLCDHLLRVEFPLAQVALEVFGAVYFFVFGEV